MLYYPLYSVCSKLCLNLCNENMLNVEKTLYLNWFAQNHSGFLEQVRAGFCLGVRVFVCVCLCGCFVEGILDSHFLESTRPACRSIVSASGHARAQGATSSHTRRPGRKSKKWQSCEYTKEGEDVMLECGENLTGAREYRERVFTSFGIIAVFTFLCLALFSLLLALPFSVSVSFIIVSLYLCICCLLVFCMSLSTYGPLHIVVKLFVWCVKTERLVENQLLLSFPPLSSQVTWPCFPCSHWPAHMGPPVQSNYRVYDWVRGRDESSKTEWSALL